MLLENGRVAQKQVQQFIDRYSNQNTLFIVQPIDYCNLNCSYCYLPGRRNYKVITNEVLNKIVKTINSSKFGNNSTVCWHGGEPLTTGIDFYKNAFELFGRENLNNYHITQSIQTNATLINNEWIKLFQKYNVQVGVSVDGPDFINDRYRVNWSSKGSHKKVQHGIDQLRESGCEFTGICVITDFSLEYPDEIFFYFLENGFSSIGLNIEATIGANTRSSLIKDSDIESNITSRYIKFINRFFDLWFKYRDKIIVREFEQIIHKLIIGRKFKARLPLEQSLKFDIITIGIGGELYYFSPDLITGISTNQKEFMIGSIFDIEDFDNLITNEKFQKIYQAINSGIRNCKRTCEYFDICGGGEPADKLYGAGSFDATQTLTCKLRKKVTCDVISKKINIDESNFA